MPIYQIIIPMQHITSVFQCWLKVNCLEFIKVSSEAIMYTFIYIPYILQRLSYTPPLEICRNDSAGPAKTCTCALMAQGISLINFNRTIQSINLNICMNLCNKKSLKKKHFKTELCVSQKLSKSMEISRSQSKSCLCLSLNIKRCNIMR